MEKKLDNNPKKNKVDFSKQGKKNRASGQRFEAKVRAGLEEMGWIVDRWTNTVEYNREEGIGKVVPSKRKYNPFRKVMVVSTGFPDFICIKPKKEEKFFNEYGEKIKLDKGNFEVLGVEVKKNGYLDQVEKGMCHWLIDNRIFSRILIAKAKKNGRKIEVEYLDFEKKFKKPDDSNNL
jgi:hypothetical protein